jgi:hypothetical protein
MKSASFICTLLVTFSLLPCFTPGQPGPCGPLFIQRAACAEETWKKEFEDVCGNTDDSMKLPADELKTLIAGCDKLKPVIEALEETPRKVYLKKLQMCRNLLAFVLETKEKK